LQLFHLKVLPEFEDFLLIAVAIEFGLFSGFDSKLLIEQDSRQQLLVLFRELIIFLFLFLQLTSQTVNKIVLAKA
jgi:hypothetical protein